MSDPQIHRGEQTDDRTPPAKPQWQNLFQAPAYGRETNHDLAHGEALRPRRPRQRRGGRGHIRAA
ncbi:MULTISPECIES: hypothetical protein [Streptomyces]|uniref:hypothetical protein n=1 Tax=Streptomyces TaxID=1883 RepID=UPI00116FBE30|nr:hypothetical protein [Streptomyces sp. CS113]